MAAATDDLASFLRSADVAPELLQETLDLLRTMHCVRLVDLRLLYDASQLDRLPLVTHLRIKRAFSTEPAVAPPAAAPSPAAPPPAAPPPAAPQPAALPAAAPSSAALPPPAAPQITSKSLGDIGDADRTDITARAGAILNVAPNAFKHTLVLQSASGAIALDMDIARTEAKKALKAFFDQEWLPAHKRDEVWGFKVGMSACDDTMIRRGKVKDNDPTYPSDVYEEKMTLSLIHI